MKSIDLSQTVLTELRPLVGKLALSGDLRREKFIKQVGRHLFDQNEVVIVAAISWPTFQKALEMVKTRWGRCLTSDKTGMKRVYEISVHGGGTMRSSLTLKVHFCREAQWGWTLMRTTGTPSFVYHLSELLKLNGFEPLDESLRHDGSDVCTPKEESLFEWASVQYIEPKDRKDDTLTELLIRRTNDARK